MKFYRKTQGAVLGGVCQGLSEEFKVDPLIFRLIVLVFFVFSAGLVGLVYLILWTVLPAQDSNSTIKEEITERLGSLSTLKNKVENPLLLGGILVGFGLLLFLNYLIPFHLIMRGILPIGLIGAGVYLLIKNQKK